MKQLTITVDIAVDAELRTLLESLGVTAWTRLPRCAGSGPRTGIRADDHIWPGYNAATLAVLPDDAAARVLAALRDFRASHPRAGLFAWCVPVVDAL